MLNFLYDIRDFLSHPLKLTIVLTSIAFALIALYMLKKKDLSIKKRLGLMYMHIFFWSLPFIYFLFQKTCEMYLLDCNAPRYVAYILSFAGITGLVSGLIVTPFIFYHVNRKNAVELRKHYIADFVKKHAKRFNLKDTKVYLLNKAKPLAFSLSHFKNRIFVSVGLVEMLSRKELEAVLLHEMSHLQSKASILKFSSIFVRVISPLAAFTPLKKQLSLEEDKADKFAVRMQKTSRYINSAKKKISGFERIAGLF